MRLSRSRERAWTAHVLTASVAQRLGAFLSTIYFIRTLGADAFGSVVPLLPVAPLLGAATLIGQDQAVLRQLLETASTRLDARSEAAVAATLATVGLLGTCATAAALLLALDIPVKASLLSGLGATFLAIGQGTWLCQTRAFRYGPAYSLAYIIFGAVGLGTRITALHSGVGPMQSWAIGDLAGGIALVIGAFTAAHLDRSPPIRYEMKRGLRYGAPLIPHALAQQALGNADKWIFAGRVPPADLAVYASAYQVAGGLSVAMSEFNRSRQHSYVGIDLARVRRTEVRERRLLLAIVAALTLPASIASALFIASNVELALPITFGICISFASLAFYLPRANYVGLTLQRTHELAIASFTGAAVNISVNFALVSAIGVWAGVIANFVGFASMFVVLSRTKTPEHRPH